jgi:hypothetical protein
MNKVLKFALAVFLVVPILSFGDEENSPAPPAGSTGEKSSQNSKCKNTERVDQSARSAKGGPSGEGPCVPGSSAKCPVKPTSGVEK